MLLCVLELARAFGFVLYASSSNSESVAPENKLLSLPPRLDPRLELNFCTNDRYLTIIFDPLVVAPRAVVPEETEFISFTSPVYLTMCAWLMDGS
jgi:hypothetical protein